MKKMLILFCLSLTLSGCIDIGQLNIDRKEIDSSAKSLLQQAINDSEFGDFDIRVDVAYFFSYRTGEIEGVASLLYKEEHYDIRITGVVNEHGELAWIEADNLYFDFLIDDYIEREKRELLHRYRHFL